MINCCGKWKRILHVCSNYGDIRDGIGVYAQGVSEELSRFYNVKVFTASSKNHWFKFSKFFALGMTIQLFRVLMCMNKNDVILVEYQFDEWNPLICLPFFLIRLKSDCIGVKIFVSLHEYGRMHVLRRKVTEFLCARVDCVFVATESMKKNISSFCTSVVIRPIPSNIEYINFGQIERSNSKYIYFGLINKTKAFQEMLEGWDKFNEDNANQLYVCTSNNYEDKCNHRNVKIFFGASNTEVSKLMQECQFCILPIIPEVDDKNGSFKAATMNGCICIGSFSDILKDLPFVVNMHSYRQEDFIIAFRESKNLRCVCEKSVQSRLFGKKYSILNTVLLLQREFEEI